VGRRYGFALLLETNGGLAGVPGDGLQQGGGHPGDQWGEGKVWVWQFSVGYHGNSITDTYLDSRKCLLNLNKY
jgi:hypothetical protein